MKKVFIIVFPLIALLLSSCKHSTESAPAESAFSTTFEFKYEKVCAPGYQQSMMLTGYSGKLLVMGCWKACIYDTLAKSWQNFTFPLDTVSTRWDGALAKSGDYLYVFGSPQVFSPKYFKVMKYNINNFSSRMLSEPLPITSYDPYPAYAETNGKILIVYPRADSVYLFDLAAEKGKLVAANEQKDNGGTSVEKPYYAFGKYGNYLYIYCKETYRLKRINLSTYMWDEISVPQEVKDILAKYTWICGAVFDGTLLLLNQEPLSVPVCYDISSDKWGYANTLYEQFFNFQARYTTDKEFYFISLGGSKYIWRVTRVK